MASIYGSRGGEPLGRYALELWLRSPRGQRLLAVEERELRRVLPDLFGRAILQIGSWGHGQSLLESSDMLQRSVIGTVSNPDANALAEPEALPILSKSADAVLLPHTLEFAPSPHNVLREADRVLTDRGRLLILGFNPWSLWGLRERFGFRYRAFPEGARFVAAHRVCDWLELLGYEVTLIRRYGVGFPWNGPQSLGRSLGLSALLGPLMEAYMIVAKKRVLPLTVMRVPRRAQVRPLLGTVSLPGARSQSE
jgi:SAM-dependent methyltransferase